MASNSNAQKGHDMRFDAIIVGAGFGGLYALHRLRQRGLSAVVLEAGGEIGGTWYWNRYPGARCDVESMQYSYSFSDEIQRKWHWSELYASQPEILAYINFVADELKLRDGVKLNRRVVSARFDEPARVWSVTTENGENYAADWCLMATGCLSIPIEPKIPGLSAFKGPIYRTSDWPKQGVDVRGKTVGLIGTGSSGIQITPYLARDARELHVFQRTPNYSIPARNRAMDKTYEAAWQQNYAERRKLAQGTRNNTLNNAGQRSGHEVTAEQMDAELESRWAQGGIGFMYAFTDMTISPQVNAAASEFVRKKIAGIVKDPAKAEKLAPKDYPIGAKRICVDTDYYQTFNRDTVFLEDVKADPIRGFSSDGVALSSGRTITLDLLVLAIGFDAMTGALTRMGIHGRNGLSLVESWCDGPQTFLGLMVAGFPNLFIVAGPQSPSVFTNMVTSIEQHVDWITAAIDHVRATGRHLIEAEPAAQAEWVGAVAELADRSLIGKGDSNSWYIGANVPGKPRVVAAYLGGADRYLSALRSSSEEGYRGFRIS